MDLRLSIGKMFCMQFKDKIDRNESYEEYFNSFTKEKIENIYKAIISIEGDSELLGRLISLSIHPKKVIVEDFKNNVEDIYKTIFYNCYEDFLNQMSIFLDNYKNDILELDLSNLSCSLRFIEFINFYCIAKVNYLKSKNKLIIYSPLELRKVISKIIKDKKIKNNCRNNSKFQFNINSLLAVYGVMPVKELCIIYSNIYNSISVDEMLDKIIINRAFDDDIGLVSIDNNYVVYNSGFEDEDHALSFYYSIRDDLDYKIYNKDEYEEIYSGFYHHRFSEFDKLYEFLVTVFNMSEDEFAYFDDIFVLDYLFSYQIDSKKAKENLNSNLDSYFEKLKIADKAFICSTILSIAKNYPNFNYKGYSYNDIKKKGNL